MCICKILVLKKIFFLKIYKNFEKEARKKLDTLFLHQKISNLKYSLKTIQIYDFYI